MIDYYRAGDCALPTSTQEDAPHLTPRPRRAMRVGKAITVATIDHLLMSEEATNFLGDQDQASTRVAPRLNRLPAEQARSATRPTRRSDA
jgi:hypothetical protein